MSKSSRRKGQDFEQETARLIRDRLGVDARRGQQQRRGDDTPDVIGMPAPWWAECKYGERATANLVVEQGWQQATLAGQGPHGRPNTKPVVFFRAQRRPLRALVLAVDLLDLLRENADLRAELERLRGGEPP